MQALRFAAATVTLAILLSRTVCGGELIRLAELPVELPPESWPAGGIVPVAAAIPVEFDPSSVAFQPPTPAVAPDPGLAPAIPADSCTSAPCDSLCDDCCFDLNVCCIPCRYFQADALFWHRVGTGCSQVLVIDANTGAPLLNTNDLNFDLAPGWRFLVGWQPDPCKGCARCCAWELSYWGLTGWNATALVAGPGNLAIPGDLGLNTNNFFLTDFISANYVSDMHNLELNCVKACCLAEDVRVDFLCGLRYIFLNENFTLTATDLQEGTSSYAIDANNNLLGLQFGGRLTQAYCRWSMELTGKAGVFYNYADTHQTVTDFPNANVIRDVSGGTSSVAMLGEMSVVFRRPLTDTWTLRLGYNVLGLGGVALGPDQLDFTDTFASGTDVNVNGWFFAHGGLVGVERSW